MLSLEISSFYMATSHQSSCKELHASSALSQFIGARLLLEAAVAIACIFNAFLIVRRLHWQCPLTPWEAGMVVDGWRALHGVPTYAADHATNMYGPLTNISSGLLFRLTGVNNYTLRLFELACYCGAAIIVAFAVVPRGWRVISFAILAMTNIRTGSYWVMSNPDGAALLFIAAFVILAYKNRTILASCALIVAVLFKQPSVAVAVIPIAAALPRPRLRDFVPIMAVGATLVVLPFASPLVFYYMFTVPRGTGYQWYRFAKAPVDLLVALPILLVAFTGWKPSWSKPEQWLVSAMVISFIACTTMSARGGSGLNSYMMFVFAALAFCCYRLPFLSGTLRVFSLSVLLTAFAYISMPIGASGEHQGDSSYSSVIAYVRSLPGKIVCPEDPTIPLYAKGYAGTSVNMEMDETRQYAHLPPRVRNEVNTADWVLTSDSLFAGKWLPETDLIEMGFYRVDANTLRGSSYKLWRRQDALHLHY